MLDGARPTVSRSDQPLTKAAGLVLDGSSGVDVGVVYRGHHAMLHRPTAIKFLDVGKTNEQTLARFEREVRLTARLSHPNTIAIYDYGRTPEGIFYYAMECLEGIDLESLVKKYGPQPEARSSIF